MHPNNEDYNVIWVSNSTSFDLKIFKLLNSMLGGKICQFLEVVPANLKTTSVATTSTTEERGKIWLIKEKQDSSPVYEEDWRTYWKEVFEYMTTKVYDAATGPELHYLQDKKQLQYSRQSSSGLMVRMRLFLQTAWIAYRLLSKSTETQVLPVVEPESTSNNFMASSASKATLEMWTTLRMNRDQDHNTLYLMFVSLRVIMAMNSDDISAKDLSGFDVESLDDDNSKLSKDDARLSMAIYFACVVDRLTWTSKTDRSQLRMAKDKSLQSSYQSYIDSFPNKATIEEYARNARNDSTHTEPELQKKKRSIKLSWNAVVQIYMETLTCQAYEEMDQLWVNNRALKIHACDDLMVTMLQSPDFWRLFFHEPKVYKLKCCPLTSIYRLAFKNMRIRKIFFDRFHRFVLETSNDATNQLKSFSKENLPYEVENIQNFFERDYKMVVRTTTPEYSTIAHDYETVKVTNRLRRWMSRSSANTARKLYLKPEFAAWLTGTDVLDLIGLLDSCPNSVGIEIYEYERNRIQNERNTTFIDAGRKNIHDDDAHDADSIVKKCYATFVLANAITNGDSVTACNANIDAKTDVYQRRGKFETTQLENIRLEVNEFDTDCLQGHADLENVFDSLRKKINDMHDANDATKRATVAKLAGRLAEEMRVKELNHTTTVSQWQQTIEGVYLLDLSTPLWQRELIALGISLPQLKELITLVSFHHKTQIELMYETLVGIFQFRRNAYKKQLEEMTHPNSQSAYKKQLEEMKHPNAGASFDQTQRQTYIMLAELWETLINLVGDADEAVADLLEDSKILTESTVQSHQALRQNAEEVVKKYSTYTPSIQNEDTSSILEEFMKTDSAMAFFAWRFLEAKKYDDGIRPTCTLYAEADEEEPISMMHPNGKVPIDRLSYEAYITKKLDAEELYPEEADEEDLDEEVEEELEEEQEEEELYRNKEYSPDPQDMYNLQEFQRCVDIASKCVNIPENYLKCVKKWNGQRENLKDVYEYEENKKIHDSILLMTIGFIRSRRVYHNFLYPFVQDLQDSCTFPWNIVVERDYHMRLLQRMMTESICGTRLLSEEQICAMQNVCHLGGFPTIMSRSVNAEATQATLEEMTSKFKDKEDAPIQIETRGDHVQVTTMDTFQITKITWDEKKSCWMANPDTLLDNCQELIDPDMDMIFKQRQLANENMIKVIKEIGADPHDEMLYSLLDWNKPDFPFSARLDYISTITDK